MKFMEYNELKEREECVFDTEEANAKLKEHDEQFQTIANEVNDLKENQTSVDLSSYALKTEIPKTANEVGADASGTATTKVIEHNSSNTSHNDIRMLIQGLTSRLNSLADSDDTTLDQLSEIVAYIKSNKSLIDSITTNKVNVTDIIDNLTTSVTNKPLSAKQGVVLKGLIDSIIVPTKVSQLQNDSGYLTQHQDISGKVDKTGATLGIHTDGLVYLFIDGKPTGTGVELGVSGDVVGYVDSSKNIVLTGDLADGSYALKYEMEDGTLVDIGNLDINVVNYTNLVPTSVTNDGVTIYNGVGYKNDVRLRTDGIEEATLAGQFATGFIPVVAGDVLRIKGATYNDNYTKIVGYDSSFTNKFDHLYNTADGGWVDSAYWNATEESDGTVTCTLKSGNAIAWARFTAIGDGANIIITKNEEIK